MASIYKLINECEVLMFYIAEKFVIRYLNVE